MENIIRIENCRIDSVGLPHSPQIQADVLRLDLIHPVVSGNKWFKLKEYLTEAQQLNKTTLATFGGAFSNHIVATAAAAQLHGLKSMGIIRGEKPGFLSHTLQQASALGMQLFFVSREAYRKKMLPEECLQVCDSSKLYVINEGGYGQRGMRGAAAILKSFPTATYSHIAAATGTGTMLAGLVAASAPHQSVVGVSVLKNNFSVEHEIKALLPEEDSRAFQLHFGYHFGGYAKHTPELFRFMNAWYAQTGIPSDFVYTGKLFFAVSDLASRSYFPQGSKILIIHSGGLQGNLSLAKGTLIF